MTIHPANLTLFFVYLRKMPLRGETSPGANRRSGNGSMAGMPGAAGGNYY